ncbi:hypothetical protein Plhal304r1_c008g0031231 [Plasmopara halstedii]
MSNADLKRNIMHLHDKLSKMYWLLPKLLDPLTIIYNLDAMNTKPTFLITFYLEKSQHSLVYALVNQSAAYMLRLLLFSYPASSHRFGNSMIRNRCD